MNDSGLDTKRTTGRTRVVYFFGALGAVLFGFDTGIISGAILGLSDDFALSALTKGVVVSSILVGAAIGSLVAGRVADRWGRRPTLLAGATLFAVGAVGASLSTSVGLLIVWRSVLGLAVGIAAVLVPLYLSEIAPTRQRGSVASLNQLMIMVGILLAGVVNVFTGDHWRVAFAFGVIPAVLMLLGLLKLPESPRWLVTHGREADARALLQRLRRPDEVESELAEIIEVEQRSHSEQAGFRELWRPWVRPIVLIGIGLAIFQQIQGINVIIYYLPTSLTENGMSASAAIGVNLGIGALNVAMTVVAIRIVDKIGRRQLLLAGSLGMVVSLGLVTVVGAIPALSQDGATGWKMFAIIVGSAGFIISYALSWGPLLWVVLGEIFPLRIRGAAMAVSTLSLWIADIAVSLSYPVMLAEAGQAVTFGMYTVICFGSYLFVRALLKETRGLSLERIELNLRDRQDH